MKSTRNKLGLSKEQKGILREYDRALYGYSEDTEESSEESDEDEASKPANPASASPQQPESAQSPLDSKDKSDKSNSSSAVLSAASPINANALSVYTIPKLPPRVKRINTELQVSKPQAEQLRVYMRSQLFEQKVLQIDPQHATKGQKKTLQNIIAQTRRELTFLDNAGLSDQRLDELLWLRAWALVFFERQYALAATKQGIKREYGGRILKKEMQKKAVENAGQARDESEAVETHIRRKSSRRASLGDAEDEPSHINGNLVAVQQYPASFAVTILNSTVDFEHASELQIPPHNHDQLSVESQDFSLETLLSHMSEELGFNVCGRICAVVPLPTVPGARKAMEVEVKLDEENMWEAVLGAWERVKYEVGEFRVDAGGEKEGPREAEHVQDTIERPRVVSTDRVTRALQLRIDALEAENASLKETCARQKDQLARAEVGHRMCRQSGRQRGNDLD